MKYIIMAGGDYHTKNPKQLLEYGTGITIIERTIKFLQLNGVEDIAISTNDPRFEWLGLPILHHENNFGNGGHWLEAFYPMDEPCCYIFGDVFFSPQAIKTATRQKHIPLNSYVSLNKPVYDEESDRTLLDIIATSIVNDPEELIISKEELKRIQSKMDELLSDLEL